MASNAVAVGLELADATPVNNHRAKVGTPGIDDLETLDDFTRLIGAGELRCSTSTQSGERGHRSQTEGDTYRDLAPANLIRERQPGTGLLVYGHLPPAKIRLRPWFEEKSLRELGRAPSNGAEGTA